MAAALMEFDGTSHAVKTSRKSNASRAESVSLVKRQEYCVPLRGAIEKFSPSAFVSSKVSYAPLSWRSSRCNRPELSVELDPRQTLIVSTLKQQLRCRVEVALQVFATPSGPAPATFSKQVRAPAAAPRVTESRRERRHPAGRQRRPHESRAPRRAGSQG